MGRPRTRQLMSASGGAAARTGTASGKRTGTASGTRPSRSRQGTRQGNRAALAKAALEALPPPAPDKQLPATLLSDIATGRLSSSVDLSHWVSRTGAASLRHASELAGGVPRTVRFDNAADLTDDTVIAVSTAWGAELAELHIVNGAGMTDSALKALGSAAGCPRLRVLCLPRCLVTDRGVRAIASGLGASLQRLSLEGSAGITDHGMLGLLQLCQSLQWLDISECAGLSDRSFTSLGAHPALRHLKANRCPGLTDPGLMAVLGLNRLSTLECAGCTALTDAAVRAIYEVQVTWGYRKHKGCAELALLDLGGAAVTDLSITWLVHACPVLRSLSLADCALDGGLQTMQYLESLTLLEELKLCGAAGLRDDGIAAFCADPRQRDRLTTLDVSRCPSVSDASLLILAKACRSLSSLALDDSPAVTDAGLTSLARYCSTLERLSCAGLTSISDAGIAAVGRRCRQLGHLCVARCRHVTAKAVRELATLKNLTSIDVSGCALFKLRESTPLAASLREVSLASLPQLDDAGIRLLAARVPLLERVDLSNCPRVTDAQLDHLAATCTNLKRVVLTGTNVDAAALERVCERHAWLRPIDDVASGAVGLHRPRSTEHAHAQARFFESEQALDAAASFVQKAWLGLLEWRTTESERQRRIQGREWAATLVQATWRGRVVRKAIQRSDRARAVIKYAMRVCVRTRQNARKRRAADAMAAMHLQRTTFRRWVLLQVARRRRIESKRNLGKEAAALHHYQHRLQRAVWAAWALAAVRDSDGVQNELVAEQHWAAKKLPVLWLHWKCRAARAVARRRRTVGLFIQCVEFSALNSSRQQAKAAIAQALHDRNLTAWTWIGFTRLCREVNMTRLKMARAAAYAEERFVKVVVAHCLRALAAYTRKRQRKLLNYARARRTCLRRRMRDGVAALQAKVVEAANMRQLKAKAEHAFHGKVTLTMFRNWKRYVNERQERRATKLRGEFHHLDFVRRGAVQLWRLKTREATKHRRMVRIASKLFSGHIVATCFNAWKIHFKTAGDDMKMAQARSDAVTRKRYFFQWRQWLKMQRETRRRQQTELNELHKFDIMAVKIQARFRGKRGRKKALEFAQFEDWAVLKLQTLYRGWKARRIYHMKKRHKRLANHLLAEGEEDLMAFEDQYAKDVVKLEKAVKVIKRTLQRIRDSKFAWYQTQFMGKLKSKKWVDDQGEILGEALEREKAREVYRQIEEEMACKLQRIYRGLNGRRRWQMLKRFEMETDAAILFQAIFRGQHGRNEAWAARRHLANRNLIRLYRRKQGFMMRLCGLRQRKTQRKFLIVLKTIGLDPVSYTLAMSEQIRHLMEDWHALQRFYTREFSAWKIGKLDKYKRDMTRRRLVKEGEKAAAVHVGDAVRIVLTGHKHLGMTASVLQLDTSLPSATVAEMRLDSTLQMVYMRLISEGDMYNPPMQTLDKFPIHSKPSADWNKIGKMQASILDYARKEKPRVNATVAARCIQMAYRRHNSRVIVARMRFQYWSNIKGKRLAFLQLLSATSTAVLQNAHSMLKNRVVGTLRPEEFIDMPHKSLIPPYLEDRMMQQRNAQTLTGELAAMHGLRKQFIQKHGPSGEVGDYLQRFRVLSKGSWLRSQVKTALCNYTTSAAASVLQRAGRGEAPNSMLNSMARFVGGREWAYSPEHKASWIGRCELGQFDGSPHVRIASVSSYHGMWSGNPLRGTYKPNGEGVVEFLKGYGVAKEEKTLRVSILRARGLKAMDMFASDPYTLVECNRKKFKTEVVPKSLQPVWEEDFLIDVTDPKAKVKISIWDWDMASKDDYMGGVELAIDHLGHGEPEVKWHPVLDMRPKSLRRSGAAKVVNRGEIEIELQWQDREEEDDIDQKRLRNKGVVVLQRWSRKELARMLAANKRIELVNRTAFLALAILQIQCSYRCYRAKKEMKSRRKRLRAIVKIQSVVRMRQGHFVLLQLRKEYYAARKLQTTMRKHYSKVLILALRLEHWVVEVYSAVVIQCLMRQFLANRTLGDKRLMIPPPMASNVEKPPSVSDWIGTYGRDPVYPSKRIRRIAMRAFNRTLSIPNTVLFTRYGRVRVSSFPADPLESDEVLRHDADFVHAKLLSYRHISCPRAEREELERKSPAYDAVISLESVDAQRTMNEKVTAAQCAFRQLRARKRILSRRAELESVCVIQRKYRQRLARKHDLANHVQAAYRRRKAAKMVHYKRREKIDSVRIQCAYRQYLARRALMEHRQVVGVLAMAVSSTCGERFSADKTLDGKPESFWSSYEGATKSQWILYDLLEPVCIGVIRLRVPDNTSAPKDCWLETGDSPIQDLEKLNEITVSMKSSWQSFKVTPRRVARYWRLHMATNYTSSKSMALNDVQLLVAKEFSPVISLDPLSCYLDPSPQIGQRGTQMTLTCDATAWPVPTYQWLKNGKALEGETSNSVTFKIYAPKSKDTKKYRCVHCRKVQPDLAENIFRVKCKNCGTLFNFPEQEDAAVHRSEIVNEEHDCNRRLKEIDVVLKDILEDKDNIVGAMRREQHSLESTDAESIGEGSIESLNSMAVEHADLKVQEAELCEQIDAIRDQQERLLHKRYKNSLTDPVKVHWEAEGIYSCKITSLRGGELPVARLTKPAIILVSDPPPFKVKVVEDYHPKPIIKRKVWPRYMSIHGWFTKGVLTGDAVIRFDSGDIYAGPLIEEKWVDHLGASDKLGRESDHWGTWITKDNYCIEGTAVDNHFDTQLINGEFRVTYPNQEIFEGQYADGQRHGIGLYRYLDQSVYEGEWFQGRRQGFGALQTKNRGSSYEGEWDRDRIHGDGCWKWPDGSYHLGSNFEGMRTGKGVYTSNAMDVYTGDFFENAFQGVGSFVYNDSSRYEGEFDNNLRHGKGTFIDPKGVKYIGTFFRDARHGDFIVRRPIEVETIEGKEWQDEVQIGLWQHGHFIEWLNEAVNPVATLQFCDFFEGNETEFDGVYALLIARRLPRLPFGVQHDHPRVVPIIDRIRKEGGELVGRDTYAELLIELQDLEPRAEDAKDAFRQARSEYESSIASIEEHQHEVDQLEMHLKSYESSIGSIDEAIENFWLNDPEHVRETFEAARDALNPITRVDCFQIRHFHDPPPIVAKVMRACCFMMLVTDDWREAQALLATSSQNADIGDEEAVYQTYEVKIIHMLKTFDVWERTDAHVLLTNVGTCLIDPRFKSDHHNVQSYGTALPLLVDFIWASYKYVVKSKQLKARKTSVDSIRFAAKKALTRVQESHKEMDKLVEASGRWKAAFQEAEILRDSVLRKVQDTREMVAACQNMITAYRADGLEVELDYYEKLEEKEAESEERQCQIVIELMLTSIEEKHAAQQTGEDPNLDLAELPNTDVKAWISDEVLTARPAALAGRKYVVSGGKLSLEEGPPIRPLEIVEKIVSKITKRVNVIMHETPTNTVWEMSKGKPVGPGFIRTLAINHWSRIENAEVIEQSVANWKKVFGAEAAKSAIGARTNWLMAEDVKAEAAIWAKAHPEAMAIEELQMAAAFEEMHPENTATNAQWVIAEPESAGGPQALAYATAWVQANNDKLNDENLEAVKTKAVEFEAQFPEDTGKICLQLRHALDDSLDATWLEYGEAWAATHTTEMLAAEKTMGAELATAFQTQFESTDAVARMAVKAQMDEFTPHLIKMKAAAWAGAHIREYHKEESVYQVELEHEDKARAKAGKKLRSDIASQVAAIERTSVPAAAAALQVRVDKLETDLRETMKERLKYHATFVRLLQAQFDTMVNSRSYLNIASTRPSEIEAERAFNLKTRNARLQALKARLGRHKTAHDELDAELNPPSADKPGAEKHSDNDSDDDGSSVASSSSSSSSSDGDN